MSKSNKLNHNRHIGSSGYNFEYQYEKEKSIPTAKQKKFYVSLKIKCKENNISSDVGKVVTRVDYANAIDKLIRRLQEKNINIRGNNKDATLVLNHKPDSRGNYYTSERININERK